MDFLTEVTQKIETQHRKIIDDWCQAYLAKEYELGNDIHPGCFVIEQSPLGFEDNKVGYKYKIVKEQTRIVDQWKNVKEELPPHRTGMNFSRTVLLCDGHKCSTGCYFYEDHLFDDDGNLDVERESIIENGWGYWEWDVDCYGGEPTHWMLLPKTPWMKKKLESQEESE